MALVVEVKVFPQSGRQNFVIDKSGILKCFILAAPEDGKANKEIIELFANRLRLKKQDIEIVGGLISRKKKVMIHATLTYEQFLHQLGLDNQTGIF
jgi:uncharacterized protein (TIGR00251 family)